MSEPAVDLTIKPLNKEQRMALEDQSPDLLLWGEGGSGKTHIAASKAIMVGSMYSNNMIFLIRRKKVDLRGTLWKRFTENLPQKAIASKDENAMIYKLTNGTEVWGFGLDSTQDVNKLASTECGLAVVEEATEIDEAYYDEKIKRAVRLPRAPFHQTLLNCNPDAPSHWIYKKWFMEKLKGYKEIFFKTLPPPYLPPSYYDWLKGLKGVFAQRYRDGKWIAIEGMVYPFDPRANMVDDFAVPKEWTKIMAIDFGFDHPFVCQWWAISPNDTWYMYRQIYMTRRTVKVHSETILEYCEKDGIEEPVAICDHDAEDRATLEENGIATIQAEKARLAGQQVVQDKFDNNKIFFFRNSLVEVDERLKIANRPIRTEQEYGTYKWANKGKEDMIKKLDDGMDTKRYAMYTYHKTVLGMPDYDEIADDFDDMPDRMTVNQQW
jgi:phage terminase large subunit